MTTEAERRPFSAVMRAFRTSAGLTQEELAERTQLSVRGISDLERGERTRPHFDTVRRIADALELDPAKRSELYAAARTSTAELPSDLRSTVTVLRSLPIPATKLVGRDREIAVAVDLLDHGELRLLTLTGPGGVGKTRLALEVATHSRDAENAVFVDLASISDTGLVATTIVRDLGLRDSGNLSPIELLKQTLNKRPTILILDNFEHV
ncbi:MAG TPA: helix-turn-helix domain-containing protein, partial [Chloroflexota bacterium]|nr:helix-turn-helix domain-containing protein [Chloroflexota bacterium]